MKLTLYRQRSSSDVSLLHGERPPHHLDLHGVVDDAAVDDDLGRAHHALARLAVGAVEQVEPAGDVLGLKDHAVIELGRIFHAI